MTMDRAQHIETQIEAIRHQRNVLQNKPWGASISAQDNALCQEQVSLTAELNRIRPYSVVKNGPGYIVAFKGMFVLDHTGDNWLTFQSQSEAADWVSTQMGVAA